MKILLSYTKPHVIPNP